jgi:cell wall-associated NlpC family hydrolase
VRYTADQIYAFARQAGFSPDQSATMTAIALAESGGDTNSHATHGEDSRGLWQINALAHPDLARSVDLYDPVQNARAAFQVSHGGADVSPWTTTHGGLAASYLKFKAEALAAAVAYGDGADGKELGVWTGTPGYGHELSAGAGGGRTVAPAHGAGDGSETVVVSHNTPVTGTGDGGTGRAGEAYGIAMDGPDPRHGAEFGIPFDPGDPAAGTDTATGTDSASSTVTATGTGAGAAGDDKVHEFLAAALAQSGDKYVFGAEVSLDDPNPTTFDCSGLVEWAAHQAGVDLERNAWMQYRQMHQSGTIIPVEQAIHTPGALLFSFDTNPDGSVAPSHQHVAISLGDGKTIEALGAQYGVGSFDATTKRFQYAAIIPGISDHSISDHGISDHAAPVAAGSTGDGVGIVIPPPHADPPPTQPDPPPPEPHPAPPETAPPETTGPPQTSTPPETPPPTGNTPPGDDFDQRLGHDPDHLDDPGDPDPPPDADHTDDLTADHPDDLALVDADADGMDDALAQAMVWSGDHPAGSLSDDGWSHDGHADAAPR